VITVNGRRRERSQGETVASLLARLGFEGGFALVERNGEPVDREQYGKVELEDGDSLVIARPVAGG
jgi:thiamine biosynthesis protein ThiS